MPAPAGHPRWCDADQCTANPEAQTGAHQSRVTVIQPEHGELLRLNLHLFQFAGPGVPVLLIIEGEALDDPEDSVILPLNLRQARIVAYVTRRLVQVAR